MTNAPLISIIIPCGPRHADHVRTAAASVAWQSIAPRCETIISCDGGAVVAPMAGVTILPSDGTRRGPAVARNRALATARGAFILPLDADDYLLPRGAEHLLRAFSTGAHGYIYGDCYTQERDGSYVLRASPPYIQDEMRRGNIHVVTALIPTAAMRSVGGYDEGVDAWEDWTAHLRLAMAGVCGYRLAQPVFTYRVHEGDRMTRFYGGDKSHMDAVWVRYRHRKEYIDMASCCGGDSILTVQAEQALRGLPIGPAADMGNGMVRIEFLGEERGTMTLEPTPGRYIRLGNNTMARYADVTPAEAAWVAERMNVRIVPLFDPPHPPEPLPIVQATDVLTPDALGQQAIRPRTRAAA